jgi:enoyl-CoA hydratase
VADWEFVTLEIEQSWALITLSRPKVLNALNQQLLGELLEAVVHVSSTPTVKALIITGKGEKAFAAGADIGELSTVDNASQAERLATFGQTVFSSIEQLTIPVIMAVNGFALGGGCELALAGDIIIASDTAKFGQPEVNLGVIPGYGGTQRLARAIGEKNAKYYIFTGEIFSSKEAHQLGLVQKVVSPKKLLPEAKELAQKLANLAPIALQYIKKSIHNGLDIPLENGLHLEASYFGLTFNTADRKEGMSAFLEKRKPTFRGE